MAKILVIDDDPGMRSATRRALEMAGHVVAVYEDGRGAVHDIDAEPPDLLITDIFMPEMEGLETIRAPAAAAAHADHRDLGVHVRGPGLSRGGGKIRRIVASLRKPFRPAELVALVERLLAKA